MFASEYRDVGSTRGLVRVPFAKTAEIAISSTVEHTALSIRIVLDLGEKLPRPPKGNDDRNQCV